MADIKISALPGASTLTGAETIPLVQGGTTKKVTTDQFLIKDGSGNVGVGVTPAALFRLDINGNTRISSAGAGGFEVQPGATTYVTAYNRSTAAYTPMAVIGEYISFGTGLGAERARIDSAGNLGLGTTTPSALFRLDVFGSTRISSAGAEGFEVQPGAVTYVTAYNRGTAAYTPMQIVGEYVSFGTGIGSERARIDASGNLTPGGDNTQNLGSGALRWSTVYAGTGTINTSDAREKTDVRVMAADEVEAAKALSKEIGIYQFLDSVAKKGDKARHHVGLTVQRAIELMKLHGLDPFAYGFICFDKWDDVVVEHPAIEAKAATEAKDEVVDAEGNVIEAAVEAQAAIEAKDAWAEVTLKAGDRYSFRYDQLNLFIACGIEARLAALEAK